MRGLHIAIAVNTSWNIVNFRSSLVRSLIEQGHQVTVLAPEDEYSPRILELGSRYVPVPMDNHGTSPVHDMMLMLRFYRVLRRERPHVFLGYTAKPNIYGSLAAHALRIPVINNIAGLGTAFSSRDWLAETVKSLYRVAVSRSHQVFFQNEEDLGLFVNGGLVEAGRCDLLPGSGVDLQKFSPATLIGAPVEGTAMRFLFVGRLLWDKGVGEYVEAARLIRRDYPSVRFQLLGSTDARNPGAVPKATVSDWDTEGVIEYLGSVDDVRPALAGADCVVLPTFYREGTPRSLLEAAAMARPIVTTDWVGSRNVVDHGLNGLLCEPRSVSDLVSKLRTMIELPPDARLRMGAAGRSKIVQEFDERLVIERYSSAIESAMAGHKKRTAPARPEVGLRWR